MADFSKLSYKQLQALAKVAGVRANAKVRLYPTIEFRLILELQPPFDYLDVLQPATHVFAIASNLEITWIRPPVAATWNSRAYSIYSPYREMTQIRLQVAGRSR